MAAHFHDSREICLIYRYLKEKRSSTDLPLRLKTLHQRKQKLLNNRSPYEGILQIIGVNFVESLRNEGALQNCDSFDSTVDESV
jgi:hypothetical protein